MQAIVKKIKDGNVISEKLVNPVVIIKHGFSNGKDGSCEYLELWKSSISPDMTVELDGYTEVLIR